jgi:hypothetical protein
MRLLRPMHTASFASEEAQDIETLKVRYEELKDKRTRADTNLENALRQLEELRRIARDTYGTDDLAALEAQLAALKAENERKRADYQQALDQIEAELASVERTFQDVAQGQDRA